MFWLRRLALKFGIIQPCPNCESAWMLGGYPDWDSEKRIECICCGCSKDGRPPEIMWGWVMPGFVRGWIIERRIKRYNREIELREERERRLW